MKKTADASVGPLGRAYSSLRRHGLIALALLLAISIGIIIGNAGRSLPQNTADMPSMDRCATDARAQLVGAATNSIVLRQIAEYCYSVLRSDQILKDFEIRKLVFLQQYHANEILLWMVVAITISGVVLAGLQLLASFRLAERNRTSLGTKDEVRIQSNQILLKSSVTGLAILVVSFAFFLIFVLYVYRIEDRPESAVSQMPSINSLPAGGLGPSPNIPAQQN